MMAPREFWRALDASLRELDAAGLPAMGPANLRGGAADCQSCTVSELEATGVDLALGAVFYHYQDLRLDRASCHLSWSGSATPALVLEALQRHGLACDLPANPETRILVRPA